jgi:glycosyltransferase involved in cell wall biosynthesis
VLVSPISAMSVVIPAYNAAGTIAPTIDSVLEAADDVARIGVQVEIVVVDDGSEDGTAEFVGERFGADPRVCVYSHRRNRGGAAARNTAVEHASHDWLYCVDSDNLVDPKSFRLVVEMAATGDWDVVAPAEARFFDASPEHSIAVWRWDHESLHINDALAAYETAVACGNYLYSRDIWAQAGGYPEFAGSLDAWGFGIRLLFAGARFGVCRDAFYLHRQGHASYYTRDTDGRRAVASAQIMLPYLDRLVPEDRARLLSKGQLLRYFAELPQQPLRVRSETQTASRGSTGGRIRTAARHAWSDWSPRTTLSRLRHGRW